MSKRSGEQCRRRASIGKAVCAIHGGKTPIGPASPQFQNGRYSKYLPERMLDRYHEAEADTDLLALKAEVALIDSRLLDVLNRVDTGESSRIWGQLRDAVTHLEAAQLVDDEAGIRFAVAGIKKLINAGAADWAAWDDVRSLVRDRQRLVESERKRLVEAQHVIAVDQAMALLALLVDAVREAVEDDHILRIVTNAYARLTGLPSPLAAVSDRASVGARSTGPVEQRTPTGTDTA
jgi:hypothetical protein